MKLTKQTIGSIKCSSCGEFFINEVITFTKGSHFCERCWITEQNNYKGKLISSKYIKQHRHGN
jgi:formylmethanofuran dehydrogenase subunit E